MGFWTFLTISFQIRAPPVLSQRQANSLVNLWYYGKLIDHFWSISMWNNITAFFDSKFHVSDKTFVVLLTCVSLSPIRVFLAWPIFFISMSPAGVLNPGVMSPGKSFFWSLESIMVEEPWFSTALARNVSGTGVNLKLRRRKINFLMCINTKSLGQKSTNTLGICSNVCCVQMPGIQSTIFGK